MASRTQIVCLHEGTRGGSVDPVFINCLIRSLNPPWIRPQGSNLVRLEACGNRNGVMAELPRHLRQCIQAGGNTTLMVWADLDDDITSGNELQRKFWEHANSAGITAEEFEQVVFAFAKDRIENWIEFLLHGATNESVEGPRVSNRDAAQAAKLLAKRCQQNAMHPQLPPSLEWSCRNWRKLAERMKNF